MKVTFGNGSTWQVLGSDNHDSLVGASVAGVVFSEWSLAKPESWTFVRPILLENDGWALFLWTPRGRNHATRAFEGRQGDAEWFTLRAPATDTEVDGHTVTWQPAQFVVIGRWTCPDITWRTCGCRRTTASKRSLPRSPTQSIHQMPVSKGGWWTAIAVGRSAHDHNSTSSQAASVRVSGAGCRCWASLRFMGGAPSGCGIQGERRIVAPSVTLRNGGLSLFSC